MTDPVLEVADELYALPLDRFTPERDARAKAAKGDQDLVAALKALRKPSLAAWVVNLLVRREAGQVEQVLAIGAALREAQEGMDGAELRALTKQRRQLTSAVTAQARALAADEGVRVTQSVADEVEATLTAGLVDPEAARAVRSGLLVRSLKTTGVDARRRRGRGGAARTRSGSRRHRRPPRRPRRPSSTSYRGMTRRAAARRPRRRSPRPRQRPARPSRSWTPLEPPVEELRARSLQLQSEIDELRRRLAELESSAEETDDELAEAEETRAEAEQAHADAARSRDTARRALDALN